MIEVTQAWQSAFPDAHAGILVMQHLGDMRVHVQDVAPQAKVELPDVFG